MNICNVCLIKYYHGRSTCFHDPRASLIGNCLLYACTWANKTLLQSFLINRWHLFLEFLLKTNLFHIHIDFQLFLESLLKTNLFRIHIDFQIAYGGAW
jgi:hypothetical protein